MANDQSLYKITKPISQLPPRELKTINITTDRDIDLVKQFSALASGMDIESMGGTGTVTINDQETFQITPNDFRFRDNVLIYRIKITGINPAFLSLYTHSLSLLKKYHALEPE